MTPNIQRLSLVSECKTNLHMNMPSSAVSLRVVFYSIPYSRKVVGATLMTSHQQSLSTLSCFQLPLLSGQSLFLFPFHILLSTSSSFSFDCAPSKPEDFETWPNHLSFRFLTRVRSSPYSPMTTWTFLRTSSLVTCSLFNSCRLKHLISKVCVLFPNSAVKVYDSPTHRNREMTRERISFTAVACLVVVPFRWENTNVLPYL